MYKKIIIISIICFIYTTQLFAEKPAVKIGLIVPLTGGQAQRGDDVTKLVSILENRINLSANKHKYEFIIEDGKCGAGNATTSAALKLVNVDKVKFIITACSGETLQAAPIAEKNKVVLFAVLSLHPEIRNLGDYIFRTFINVDNSIKAFCKYMSSESEGKVAILTEENAFTFSIRDMLQKNLTSEIIFADDFSASSSDFSALFAKIKTKGAKGIYLNAMSESTLSNLVNQARRMGLRQKLFSYNMPEIASFRTATGKNSDDLYFIGTPEIKSSSNEYKSVFAEYLEKYPQGPSYEFVLQTSYDAIMAIVNSVEIVGTDSTKVKDYLYKYSADGATGKVSFDEYGDIKNLNYVLRRMNPDGKHEVVRDLVTNIE